MSDSEAPGATFRERFVDTDGFRIRYMEGGEGVPLLHLHGAGGMHLTEAHHRLRRQGRLIAFEMPGFGNSTENTRTQSTAELAATMMNATARLGIEHFNLMGSSFGAKVALWLAALHPERVLALVLEAPAAIRPAGHQPPSGTPEEMVRALFAHPDQLRTQPRAPDPAVWAKMRALTLRVRGPDRDAPLEAKMRVLTTPTLVLFGTHDRIMPPEMGRLYKELMPNCHLVFVYDAGHAISAERPEAFVAVVEDFLERHEAFVIAQTTTLMYP